MHVCDVSLCGFMCMYVMLASQQSTRRSDELRPGQSVKLVVPCFGEVGIGSVVDVHPSGQWLGVTIPPFSVEFILLRPSTIVANAENLTLEPR